MAHLRKKKGSPYWFAVWRAGRQVINRSTKETNYNKAITKMGKWAAEAEKSFHKKIGKITFGELSTQWLESQKQNLKKQTAFSYQEALNRVSPFFEHRIVRDIRPEHIERFKNEMTNEKEDVKKIAPRTVNFSIWILRAVLDYAVRLGYCHSNAGKLVKGIKETSKERKTLSLEQLRKLFDTAPEGQWRTLITFAALVGCRLGECLAAQWQHFDKEAGTLDIRQSFGKFGLGTPKTKSSVRTVNLPQALVDKLMELKAIQNQQRLKAGASWENNDLIFCTQTGGYIDQGNVRAAFYKIVEKAGFPHMAFHDLRSVACTLLLESGASLKHTMEQLGHSTPEMTLQIYAGVTKEGKRQAQENLQTYVFGKPA